jgi:hypothetical protein
MPDLTSKLASVAGAAVGTVVGTTSATVTWARRASARTVRLLDTAEVVFEELLLTLRETRPLLRRLDTAVDDGVLEDLARMVERLDKTLAMLEEVAREAEGRLPSLDSVAATQADVEGARLATERLVALVDATLTQLDSLPGAGLVRRRMSRVAAEAEDDNGPTTPVD